MQVKSTLAPSLKPLEWRRSTWNPKQISSKSLLWRQMAEISLYRCPANIKLPHCLLQSVNPSRLPATELRILCVWCGCYWINMIIKSYSRSNETAWCREKYHFVLFCLFSPECKTVVVKVLSNWYVMHRVGQNICKCTETKTSKNIPCCCYAVALFHFHLSSRVIKETDEKNCTLNHLCKPRLWSPAAVHALLCVWNSFPGWKRRVSQDKQERFYASMFPNWAWVCETNNNNNKMLFPSFKVLSIK